MQVFCLRCLSVENVRDLGVEQIENSGVTDEVVLNTA